MSHFAKVEDGIVTQVMAAEQDFIDTQDGEWVQTSKTGAIRKNYAGVGYIYDSTRDAFYEPQPFSSWILDEDTCYWGPPVAYPDDDKRYNWDEDTTAWVEVTE
jgi:hypothetical protein